jgi:hypothetical protein
LLRQVVPEEDAGAIVLALLGQARETPLLQRSLDVCDMTLEDRVNAFESDEGIGAVRRDNRLADDRRPGAGDTRHRA